VARAERYTYEEMNARGCSTRRGNTRRTTTGPLHAKLKYTRRTQPISATAPCLTERVSALPKVTRQYPLLMTNAKEDVYMLTGYKQIASLRNMKPEPVVEMHPKTASRMGSKRRNGLHRDWQR